MASQLIFLVELACILQFHHVLGTASPYRVTTILGAPYMMTRSDGTYEGFLVDILNEASKIMNFTYQIQLVADNRYGRWMDEDKTNWTGMIGELVNNQADIAAADLTVTFTRSMAVSFSQPYMQTGLRILLKQPPSWKTLENLSAILTPMSSGVWAAGLVLCFTVISVLCVIGRLSPWERQINREGLFTLDSYGTTLANNCIFALAGFTRQGSSVVPRSVSGRIVAISWWIFSMFFLVIYGANLTAFFITREPLLSTLPFTSFDSMTRQTAVEIGFVQGGSTELHFKTGQYPVEKNVWGMVKNRPNLRTKTVKEGVDRVLNSNGKYAFIMEGAMAEYMAGRNCDLTVVGEARGGKMFSFACRDDSVCSILDVAILTLKENEQLNILKDKWFSSKCPKDDVEEVMYYGQAYVPSAAARNQMESKSLTLYRFAPALIIIVVGILLSAAILGVEILWAKYYRKPMPNRMTDERMSK